MTFVAHPWVQLKYAWSIRFNLLAALLILGEPAILGFFNDHIWRSTWSQLVVRLAIGMLNLLAIWAKLTWQPKLQQKLEEKTIADQQQS